jgi:iron complex transport system ATP-binding protein
MNAGDPIVVVESVSFAYNSDGPVVLSEVTWNFRRASVTALLGPNGSGKTSLLNLILGWLSPGQGRIRIDGRAQVSSTRREWSRTVGLVPQDESPAFELELEEHVLLGRAPHLALLERPGPADRKAAETALDRTGLTELRRRPVHSLSGGERQLAAIARVLAQGPDVYLLDEPLSHLDLANTRRILKILESIRREGRTVILTTHDPNVAALVADEAVLLKEGRILAGGSAASVLNAENLSATYGVEVDVRTIDNRLFVLPRL